MAPQKHLTIWSLLLATSILAGCASTPDVVTNTVYVPMEIPVKDRPEPVDLHDVEFYVVTADNMEEFIKEFQDKTGDPVFIALSVPHYESLSLNLAELRRYIEQQKAIIVYYETRVQEGINTDTNNYSPDQE